MKRKKEKVQNIIEIKCSVCGKVTKHYLSKNGDYKCLICGNVDKTIKLPTVTFECDKEFINQLNENENED